MRTARLTAAALALAAVFAAAPARALSVSDWQAKPEPDQIAYILRLVDTNAAADPARRQAIEDYFRRKGPGSPYTPGGKLLYGTIELLNKLASVGAADLSKIQVEWLVQWTIGMEFPKQ